MTAHRFLIILSLAVTDALALPPPNPIPQLPKVLKGNNESSPETIAALFMLNMYEKGLAGGDTGICIDYDMLDGKDNIRIGFNTDAFVTGKADLRTDKNFFDPNRLRSVLQAIAKAQGKPVQVSVAGYADGQHYKNASGLEDSIKRNEMLALARANTIVNLFKSDQDISFGAPQGFASPELERMVPTVGADGIECGTRRKVVLDVSLDQAFVQAKGDGSFNMAPDGFPRSMDSGSRSMAMNEVNRSAQFVRKARGETEWKRVKSEHVDAVFDDLMKRGVISKACTEYPLNLLTKAFIHAKIDPKSVEHEFEYLKDYFGKNSPLQLDPRSGGLPSGTMACFLTRSNARWNDTFKFENGNAVQSGKTNGYFIAGKDMLALQKSNYSADSKFKVGFDPATMPTQNLRPMLPAENDPNPRKDNKRGLFCNYCGEGFFFEDNQRGAFHPEHHDRLFDDVDASKNQIYLKALKNLADTDPTSLGAFSRPRIAVIKNCAGCACDPMARIAAKDPSVDIIDPLSEGDQKAYHRSLTKTEMDQTCVGRLPYWHTCGASPSESKPNSFAKFQSTLKFTDPNTGTTLVANDLEGLINEIQMNAKRSCPIDGPTPPAAVQLTAQERVNSVACSGDAARRLPSGNEIRDCRP